jgi:hypothetical protein
MKKLLGAAAGGTLAVLAGTAAGIAITGRKRRDELFWRDFRTSLLAGMGFYDGRRSAAAHEDVPHVLALELLGTLQGCRGLPGFNLVQDDLEATVELNPDTRNLMHLTVTIEGSDRALELLRQRLLTNTDPRLIVTSVGDVSHSLHASRLMVTVLVPKRDFTDLDALSKKLGETHK